VEVFDHRADGQLLFFKERFVGPQHPLVEAMAEFSRRLAKLGIVAGPFQGPRQVEFAQVLAARNLTTGLYSRRPEALADSESSSAASRSAIVSS
jgi:hypothetical protein